jgi:hypothetical protein
MTLREQIINFISEESYLLNKDALLAAREKANKSTAKKDSYIPSSAVVSRKKAAEAKATDVAAKKPEKVAVVVKKEKAPLSAKPATKTEKNIAKMTVLLKKFYPSAAMFHRGSRSMLYVAINGKTVANYFPGKDLIQIDGQGIVYDWWKTSKNSSKINDFVRACKLTDTKVQIPNDLADEALRIDARGLAYVDEKKKEAPIKTVAQKTVAVKVPKAKVAAVATPDEEKFTLQDITNYVFENSAKARAKYLTKEKLAEHFATHEEIKKKMVEKMIARGVKPTV